jgi:acetyl esterase/lipase
MPFTRRTAIMAGTTALGLLALAGCSAAGLLNGVSRLSGDGGTRLAMRGAAYGPLPRNKLDVWVPAARTASPLPVVIFFYGGGWVSGDRGDYGFAGRAFAARGFVTIVADYRLVPEVRFPAFLQDGALAVKWARDHVAEFGGDPKRISLAGHSAGAYEAAMLALDPHYLRDVGVDPKIVRAATLLAAPTDFYPFTEMRGRDALGQWPNPRETQPISFARADAPPILLMHGTADTVVRPYNSQHLAAKLTRFGATAELRLYPGKNHVDLVKSLSPLFRGTTPALADSVAFLDAHNR